MMDFITIPLVVGMITLGIYKLFELFVRRKERLSIIEKLGEKLDISVMQQKMSLPFRFDGQFNFGTLKVACLLLGVGLGLLVGYAIVVNTVPGFNLDTFDNRFSQGASVVYGASVLLFGGLGLLVAFLVEMNYIKKKKEE
ncbi:MAG: hypothetical protein H6Q17_641 [Bacteroidetes bacterium]|jgi:hypothetical protein|nr:hypothetical protein [Bacteroidota bacterium]